MLRADDDLLFSCSVADPQGIDVTLGSIKGIVVLTMLFILYFDPVDILGIITGMFVRLHRNQHPTSDFPLV